MLSYALSKKDNGVHTLTSKWYLEDGTGRFLLDYETITVFVQISDSQAPASSRGDLEGEPGDSSAPAGGDVDGDGVVYLQDNCAAVPNALQGDVDGDGLGDACDGDVDGDGWANYLDNCDEFADARRTDTDRDGQGDVCDVDDDGDGVLDGVGVKGDNCGLRVNGDQANLDGDALGDVCDPDRDNDGVGDLFDWFPNDVLEWSDFDGDGVGDNADLDDDGDGVLDGEELASGSSRNSAFAGQSQATLDGVKERPVVAAPASKSFELGWNGWGFLALLGVALLGLVVVMTRGQK